MYIVQCIFNAAINQVCKGVEMGPAQQDIFKTTCFSFLIAIINSKQQVELEVFHLTKGKEIQLNHNTV